MPHVCCLFAFLQDIRPREQQKGRYWLPWSQKCPFSNHNQVASSIWNVGVFISNKTKQLLTMSRFQWNVSNSLLKSDSVKTGHWGFSDQRLRYKNTKPKRPNSVYGVSSSCASLDALVEPVLIFHMKLRSFGKPEEPSELHLELWGFALETFAFFAVWQESFVKQQNWMKCSEKGQSKKQSTNGSVLGCLVLLLCISDLLFISFLLISFFTFLTSFLFIWGPFSNSL